MAVAVQWVATITTIAIEFFLPGLAGLWADRRWGTGVLGVLGLAFGMAAGLYHLVLIARSGAKAAPKRRRPEGDEGDVG